MMKRLLLSCLLGCLLIPMLSFAGYAVQLPAPKINKFMYLDQAIATRRSQHNFVLGKGVSNKQISQLLWAAQGVSDQSAGLRTVPSAGALYPLKVYLLNQDGLWLYTPDANVLKLISAQDQRVAVAGAAFSQNFIAQAPVVFIIAANPARTVAKYSSKRHYFVYLEAGHASQNLLLEAVSLGLAATPVGGFHADEVRQILDLPKDEEPLYLIPVGYADAKSSN